MELDPVSNHVASTYQLPALVLAQPINSLLADIFAVVDVVEQLIADRVHLTVAVAVNEKNVMSRDFQISTSGTYPGISRFSANPASFNR